MYKKLFKILILSTAMILTALLIASCSSKNTIPKGANVCGLDLSDMTQAEAVGAVSQLSPDDSDRVNIKVDMYDLTYTAHEVGAYYDAERTVESIINSKRNIFKTIMMRFKPVEFEAVVLLDASLLDSATSNKLYGVERDVINMSYQVTDDGISVMNGLSGARLNRDELAQVLCREFGKKAEDRETEEISMDITAPDEVDYDTFLSQFQQEGRDACYVRYDSGAIVVAEEQAGVKVDLESAKALMQQHSQEGELYLIPAEVFVPKYTKAELEKSLFADTLAEYSSSFSSSAQNRIDNITLASSKINSIVLMPGETFSFNEALGERTIENGYKVAHAYAAGSIVDQVGGGICQVSSTLYNTALLSNLMIVERRSHQMTVSYVPLGRDATVNWGTQDFKFNNNTYYPIKINSYISGKKITISMIGTKVDPSLKVSIETETISEIPSPEQTVDDPTMLKGERKVEKKGSVGYVVDAYRIVTSNGEEISREKLKRSNYNATATVVKVGTMEPPTQAVIVTE